MTVIVDESLNKLFQRTKGQLFFSKTCSGLLGRMLCTLDFKWDDSFSTAAISPRMLYWNPEFFLSLDEQTRVTVLAHELYHKARLHHQRRGNRDSRVYNWAGDYVINNDLKDAGFYMGGFPYLLDDRFRGMETGDVYDILVQEDPLSSALGMDIFEDPDMDVNEYVNDAIASFSAARFASQPGSIPGESEVFIDEFLNPVLPWNQLLYNFFNELTDQEYSYARPNRRYDNPLMRGLVGTNGLDHLIYYLDVSGSISDEQVVRFNSEVKFIKDELQPEKLTLVLFDTRICDVFTFAKDEPFEKIVTTGRGGTDLQEVFEHMKAEAPTAAVIFTDLCVSIPENPGIPIIWAISGNDGASVPYGRLIFVPEERTLKI
jgi:predicted metal-dependent peptidase